jgi:hypothetical protein
MARLFRSCPLAFADLPAVHLSAARGFGRRETLAGGLLAMTEQPNANKTHIFGRKGFNGTSLAERDK